MRWTLSRAAALAGLFLGTAVVAQPPQNEIPLPRITAALPCGARAGTVVTVAVSGTELDDAAALVFSHPKIAAVLIPEDEPEPKDKKKRGRNQRRGPQPETVKFLVTVPAEVPAGQYDVRVANPHGVSNPRAFVVGDRPESLELEANDNALLPDPSPAAVVGGPAIVPSRNAPRAQRVELGTTIHGAIGSATDVDYLVFAGQAGQRVLGSCLASSIDSRARPLVELYDLSGKKIAQNRNYKDNDALLDVSLPADGDYFVRVCEFAYQQGGPDYFYRLTLDTRPWIDAVFPPAVNPGKPTPVTLYGRNLPGGTRTEYRHRDGQPVDALTVTVNPPTERTRFDFHGRVPPPMGIYDAFEYRLTGPRGASNAVPIFLTGAHVVTEKDGNDRPESAEAIAAPCEVAGHIGTRNDRDYFTITAKKDEVLHFELIGEQTGSAADLFLRVLNEKGQTVSPELDDDPTVLHPVTFYTRTTDPPGYKFTVPADGKYVIVVGSLDAGMNYGPRCFYRLRVGPPVPDFRAVVMARSHDLPAAVTARPDGEAAYDVYVHRRDGFTDAVTVTAENLPPGVTCKPSLVGSRTQWGTLVLSIAAGAKEFTGPITVKCSATIDGKTLTRDARPASITWGIPPRQNIPTVARLDQQLLLAVRPERSAFRIIADLAAIKVNTRGKDGKEKEEPRTGLLYLMPGDKLTVPVKVVWQEKEKRPAAVAIQAEATQQNNQQAPLTANNTQIATGQNDAPVTITVRPNAPPGTYAVALRGETQVPYVRDPEQKDKKTNVNVSAYAQPIEVTVLPRSLAKLTAQPVGRFKPGATGELVVKVDRQFDYAGEFELTITLPKGVKGVTVKGAAIPSDKNEVRVPVELAKDAKPGPVNNIVVEAVATVHGKFPIVHETKVNLTVGK